MATVLFPSTLIRSQLPILTFDTCDLSNSLKSSWSWVMWLVQPLSSSQHSLVVACKTCCYKQLLFFLLICILSHILLLKIVFANSHMMSQLIALFTLNIRSSSAFERRMIHSAIVLSRKKSFVVSIIVATVSCCFLGVEIFLLVFLPLDFFSLVSLQFSLQCSFHRTLSPYFSSLLLGL